MNIYIYRYLYLYLYLYLLLIVDTYICSPLFRPSVHPPARQRIRPAAHALVCSSVRPSLRPSVSGQHTTRSTLHTAQIHIARSTHTSPNATRTKHAAQNKIQRPANITQRTETHRAEQRAHIWAQRSNPEQRTQIAKSGSTQDPAHTQQLLTRMQIKRLPTLCMSIHTD